MPEDDLRARVAQLEAEVKDLRALAMRALGTAMCTEAVALGQSIVLMKGGLWTAHAACEFLDFVMLGLEKAHGASPLSQEAYQHALDRAQEFRSSWQRGQGGAPTR